jgi:hypothetical protein
VHDPPEQVCVQSPWAHCIEQLVHVWSQLLWAHVPVHVEPDGQTYWQSERLPAHVSEHEAPAGQVTASTRTRRCPRPHRRHPCRRPEACWCCHRIRQEEALRQWTGALRDRRGYACRGRILPSSP